ncbi:MAG: DUF721 domain-containing protein, partial [Pseudomonadota bacterium]|nr:DUF721 domain-containing protein [Pseudomonadota bacterium]
GGTLAIAVENGFSLEFQHMQPVILERMATYFGYQAITRIVIARTFEVSETPPPAPAKKIPSRNRTVITEAIDDGELREALQSLAETLSHPRT